LKIELLEYTEPKKALLPEIVNRIFSICKNDEYFPIKKEMRVAEDIVEELEKKKENQGAILIQSTELKKNLDERLHLLSENNFQLKSRLLETLGSEL